MYVYGVYFPLLAIRLYFNLFVVRSLKRLLALVVVTWIRMRKVLLLSPKLIRLRKDKRSSLDKTLARAVTQKNIHNVGILLERGADPSQNMRVGYPILLLAVMTRQHEVARLLLEAGASPNVVHPASKTSAIWYAARKNDIEMIRLLLQYGADVNAHGTTGLTALMEAIENNNAEMVCLLLASGADPSRTDLVGSSPISCAERIRNDEILNILVAHQAASITNQHTN